MVAPVLYTALAIFALLLSALPCHGQNPREAVPGTEMHVYREVNGVKLDLQVMQPAESFARPRPAIVFFYGGGWNAGNVRQFVPFGEELTRRGMVSIFVDYRVASRHQTTPTDSTADAHAAMRFVRKNAQRLGIHPDRIVAAGGSAGGHLALATTLVEPFERSDVSPAANLLIGYNPVADLREERWRNRFQGDPARISPIVFVRPDLPDALLFHGDADTTVPIRQARDFCAAMRKAGNGCELEEAAGAAHGYFNFGRDENLWYPKVLEKTIAFLAQRGYVREAKR
jgi:acetyl esterase